MDFGLSEDQRLLKAGFREVLRRCFGRESLRAVVDEDGPGSSADPVACVDRALWRELGRAGFFGLRLPEDHPSGAGAGLGLPEAVLIFEEAGRALLPGPLVATELAAGLADGVVDGAATGDSVVTALDLPGGIGSAEGSAGDGAEGSTSGGGPLVAHLAEADAVLVIGDDGARVRPADRFAAEARTRRLRSVDPATPLHRVTRYDPWGVGQEEGRALSARLRREAALLTAAEQLGCAFRTLHMAVRHAGEREQFGRRIGAFQAVKHLCAGMLVRAEPARAAVYAAAVTGAAPDIAAAKLLADEAAVRNARDCLQVHGGMGFTWESEVHLHLKRAWVRAEAWLAGAAAEEELADRLPAEPAPDPRESPGVDHVP